MTLRRRRGRPRDEAKGDAILDAGWTLFLERGVGAVTIQAIAARAGVAKMTIYKHFADKHALFEAAVLREMRAIEAAQIIEATCDQDKPDLERRLHRFGMGIMSFLATDAAIDFYNVLSGELRRHPGLARTFYEAGPARTIANLAAILAGEADRIAVDDPVKAAEALIGLWQGASNFRVALGVKGTGSQQAIAARVDYGIAVFLKAFARPCRDPDRAPREPGAAARRRLER